MQVIISPANQFGFFRVKTVADDGTVSSRVLQPGHYEQSGAVWVTTDITSEPAEVQNVAIASWAPSVIAAAQALASSQLPPPPSADQILTGKIFANARRKAIITAIQTSDDVQLSALIAARYPGLAGDAIKAVTDIFLTIAGYIRN